jgi:hypothetical protein
MPQVKVGDFCWHRRDGMNRCGVIFYRGDSYVTIFSPDRRDIRFCGVPVDEHDIVELPLSSIWFCCGAADLNFVRLLGLQVFPLRFVFGPLPVRRLICGRGSAAIGR